MLLLLVLRIFICDMTDMTIEDINVPINMKYAKPILLYPLPLPQYMLRKFQLNLPSRIWILWTEIESLPQLIWFTQFKINYLYLFSWSVPLMSLIWYLFSWNVLFILLIKVWCFCLECFPILIKALCISSYTTVGDSK